MSEPLADDKKRLATQLAHSIKIATDHLGENPKDRAGEKKIPLNLVPKAGIAYVAMVMKLGAKKYGPYNWRKNRVREQVYIDAACRHLIQAESGEDLDSESGMPHYAHAAACMLILLDARATGNLVDDRNKAEQVVNLLKELSSDLQHNSN